MKKNTTKKLNYEISWVLYAYYYKILKINGGKIMKIDREIILEKFCHEQEHIVHLLFALQLKITIL